MRRRRWEVVLVRQEDLRVGDMIRRPAARATVGGVYPSSSTNRVVDDDAFYPVVWIDEFGIRVCTTCRNRAVGAADGILGLDVGEPYRLWEVQRRSGRA